jgi:hypothetical protein
VSIQLQGGCAANLGTQLEYAGMTHSSAFNSTSSLNPLL